MAPLTIREVSVRVGLSIDRTRALVRSGVLKAFCPGGGKYLVKPEDLAAFIEASSVAKPHTAATPQPTDQGPDLPFDGNPEGGAK